jgi:hypothetical protein
MALIIQGAVGFALSIYSGVAGLISFSVLNMAFAFLLTCISLLIIKRKNVRLHGQNILPWLGIAICIYLIYSTTLFDKVVGAAIIVLGIPVYVFFSPKADVHHMKRLFISEESIFARRVEHREKFLAHFIMLIHRTYRHFRHDVRVAEKDVRRAERGARKDIKRVEREVGEEL